MEPLRRTRPRGAGLIASVNRLSILISSAIILVVQIISIFIMTVFVVNNLNLSAAASASLAAQSTDLT